MIKRWISAVGAAAAVLLIGVAPVVMSRENHTSDVGDSLPSNLTLKTWESDEVGLDDEVRDEARRVFESFAGTIEQRNALGLLRAYEANRGMDECLAAAGFDEWDWSLARTYGDPIDPLSTNVWLAEPFGRWRSQDLLAARPFLLAEAKMNADDQSDAQMAAVHKCSEIAPPPAKLNDEAAAVTERLSLRWWDMVRDYRPEGMPDDSAYLACVDAANPSLLRGYGASELGQAMTAASPPDSQIPSDPTDPEQWDAPGWQEFLQLEQEYLEADWSCREQVYSTKIAGLTPLIEEFEARHQAEISQASKDWAEVLSQAENLS